MAPIVSLGSRMEKETLGKHCKHPSLLIFSVWVRAPNVPEKADRMFVLSFGLRQQELSDRESLRYLSHLKKQPGRAAEFLGKWNCKDVVSGDKRSFVCLYAPAVGPQTTPGCAAGNLAAKRGNTWLEKTSGESNKKSSPQ